MTSTRLTAGLGLSGPSSWNPSSQVVVRRGGASVRIHRRPAAANDPGHQAEALTTVIVEGADDDVTAAEARTVAKSLRTAAWDVPGVTLPPRPAEADFSASIESWRSGRDPASAPTHRITHEEALAAARHFGVPLLPGVDTSVLGQVEPAVRPLVTGVAWRSLLIRGFGAEGDDLTTCLELAASHDLILVLSSQPDGATEWYAARPDRAVRIRHEDGLLAVSAHDTAELADLVLNAASPGTVRVSSVFRRGGLVVGGEATWEQGAARPGDDELREQLAGLAPVGTKLEEAR